MVITFLKQYLHLSLRGKKKVFFLGGGKVIGETIAQFSFSQNY